MKITVIGSGYVGTTTALVLAKLGHEVIGYDVDDQKVMKLNSGILPFSEPGLGQLLQEQLNRGSITFTSDGKAAVENSEILMISVGTPSTPSGAADLTYLRQVLDTITKHINGPKIVVTKSTVPIGTNRWIKLELLQKIDTSQYPVEVVSNPEFLREGAALYDSLQPSRMVIGGEDEQAVEKVRQLYTSLYSPFIKCNYETAEMIKYASNGFLAAKISFINEIARLADLAGADIKQVAAGMGMDPRISPHHLFAGIGYGGSCFPKDVDELIYYAEEQGMKLQLLKEVKRINDSQIEWFVQKIESHMPLHGRTVVVMGVTFKEDTDDQRESPGIKLIDYLLGKGVAKVRIVDPTVESPEQIYRTKGLKHWDSQKVAIFSEKSDAAAGAHAVVLAAPWPQFEEIDWKRWAKQAESAYLFDGRNFLDPQKMRSLGWVYVGIARGDRL